MSYAATTPMCPSFKASSDVRHSPKGRADALRSWKAARDRGTPPIDEKDLFGVLDTCLGCKACASSCPIQVDIPQMRSAFYADFYRRNRRPLADRLTLLGERLSPYLVAGAKGLRPLWRILRPVVETILKAEDLPETIARRMPAVDRIAINNLCKRDLSDDTVLVWQDWFTALFDEAAQRDAVLGLRALGYQPLLVEMLPAGKAAQGLGDERGFQTMAAALSAALTRGAATRRPMIGLDPAFVMMLRQDYRKAGYDVPDVMLPQEFLAKELGNGRSMPKAVRSRAATLLGHCTEISAQPEANILWREVFAALGVTLSTPATGCCGMAGLFGHQRRHQSISRKLFDMSWKPRLDENAASLLTATGFSCRCQSERLAGIEVQHPLGLIASILS